MSFLKFFSLMSREEKKIVALMGCSHAVSHGYLLILPTVLLLLQKEFSMGYLGLGMISNIMFFAYGLGALPGGMVYNYLGPRKLYLICFLGSALVSLLVAGSPNFLLFTIGIALLGALGSIYHPLANALITSKVKEYSRGLGIHGAAGNVGLAVAPFLAGLISWQWGWRAAYLSFAVPGIVLSLCSLFVDMATPSEDKNLSFSKNPSPLVQSSGINLGLFFSLPLILLYLLNMLHSFSFHGAITFLPTYMAKYASFRLFSWDSVAMGGMLSGMALFIGVFGQYTGGLLGQKPGLEKKFLVISILNFPFILAMAFLKGPLLFFVTIAFFFWNFALQPMTNVLLAQYTTVAMRGTAFGIFFFAAFGIGSFASSFSGYLAQNFGLSSVFMGLSFITLILIIMAAVLLKFRKEI